VRLKWVKAPLTYNSIYSIWKLPYAKALPNDFPAA
jgi:hypothetical protein